MTCDVRPEVTHGLQPRMACGHWDCTPARASACQASGSPVSRQGAAPASAHACHRAYMMAVLPRVSGIVVNTAMLCSLASAWAACMHACMYA
eukprot:353547-Chlamydomonas_euryale.AAC.10